MGKQRTAIVRMVLLGAGAVATWVLRQRARPTACPFGQHIFLDLPRPFLRRDALPRFWPRHRGRMLEVGRHRILHSRSLIIWNRRGQIDALDLQQAMLDEMMGRAHARGLSNVVPMQGTFSRSRFRMRRSTPRSSSPPSVKFLTGIGRYVTCAGC